MMVTNSELTNTLKKNSQRMILIALVNISPPLNRNDPPPHESWPTTRDISNASDISIYRARNILLSLAERGLVRVSRKSTGHSLRWYPHKDLM
ncbi:hypothetical protein I5P78_25980 [Serratia marcescens]|nr:hypothetical protein [Serratia marcescens]